MSSIAFMYMKDERDCLVLAYSSDLKDLFDKSKAPLFLSEYSDKLLDFLWVLNETIDQTDPELDLSGINIADFTHYESSAEDLMSDSLDYALAVTEQFKSVMKISESYFTEIVVYRSSHVQLKEFNLVYG